MANHQFSVVSFVFVFVLTFCCTVIIPSADARATKAKKAQWERVITVDKSGRGDFKKIQDAINDVPSNNVRPVFIRVEPGVYKEKITVPADKPLVTLSGRNADTTIITWDDSGNIIKSPTVTVLASDFIGRYLTIQNTFGSKAKAVALRVAADKAEFYACRILSYQDTLLDETGRHFYSNCYIEGATDFICGNANSLFQKCHIHSISGNNGAITAQQRMSTEQNTGFYFLGCKITGVKSCTLGRPWGPYSRGCDASVLLDDTAAFVSEKSAFPNANSLRGFEVIDEIKAQIEQVCPETVSCADIVAFAARASTVLSGGPYWELPLGRRDSKAAYFKLANTTIPAPIFTVQQLLQNFRTRGLDEVDLVALSGGHTIGMSRCASFKKRLYNQNGNSQPDVTLERAFLSELRAVCPSSGGDNNLSPLDYSTPRAFDNTYFKLILGGRGLLFSDQQLFSGNFPNVAQLVKAYAQDEALFFDHFAKSMVKMGSLTPLLGNDGEIRRNCRRVNYYE